MNGPGDRLGLHLLLPEVSEISVFFIHNDVMSFEDRPHPARRLEWRTCGLLGEAAN